MSSDADIQKQFEQTQQAKPDTEYVVLQLVHEDSWTIAGPHSARDGNAAIKALLARLPEDAQKGTFVAVPARSWKPVKVTPQVVTNLLLEETN